MYKVVENGNTVEIVKSSNGYHSIFEILTELLQKGYGLKQIIVTADVLMGEGVENDLLNCWKVYG